MKWLLPRLSEGVFRRVGYAAMVVSGLSLFTEAAGQVVSKTPIAIDYSPLTNGMTTQLQWRNKLFSLEFEYDEGFEFEHRISFSELPPDKQAQKLIKLFLKKYSISRNTRMKCMSIERVSWKSLISRCLISRNPSGEKAFIKQLG